MSDEQVVEQQQEAPEYESEAKAQGWVPKDDFRGS